jgi:hypothetical protein
MVIPHPTLTRESSTRSVSSLYECKATEVDDYSFYPNNQKRIRRTKKNVTFNFDQTEIISVMSNNDYTSEERTATFYSRQEYQEIKDNIKHLVNYLRYQKYPKPTHRCSLDFRNENDVCVRGLECLADEFVSVHRRRIRQLSLTAVFAFQNLNSNRGTYGYGSDSENSQFCSNYQTETIAKAYMTHSIRSQGIASHWGHFDALDAELIYSDDDHANRGNSTCERTGGTFSHNLLMTNILRPVRKQYGVDFQLS